MAKTYKQINASGSGSGSATPYTQAFDATLSWGAPSGGFYLISVPEAIHGKSVEPLIQVYEKVGLDYEQVTADLIVTTAGDIVLRVTQTLDNRFEGKIVIL